MGFGGLFESAIRAVVVDLWEAMLVEVVMVEDRGVVCFKEGSYGSKQTKSACSANGGVQ